MGFFCLLDGRFVSAAAPTAIILFQWHLWMKQDSTTQDVSFLHTQIQTGRRSLESMQQLLLYGIMRRRQGIVMRIYIHCLLFSLVLLVNELSAQHISSKFISTHTFGDLSVLQVSKESHWYVIIQYMAIVAWERCVYSSKFRNTYSLHIIHIPLSIFILLLGFFTTATLNTAWILLFLKLIMDVWKKYHTSDL